MPGLEQDTSNLDSWSNMSLITKSNYYYLASIKAEELKTSGTEDYKSILDLKNDRIYRPFYSISLLNVRSHTSQMLKQDWFHSIKRLNLLISLPFRKIYSIRVRTIFHLGFISKSNWISSSE